MAKTEAQLKTEVAELLRLVAPGQSTLPSEHGTVIGNKYGDVFKELEDMGIAYWSQTSIPDVVFNPLAKVVAGECASKFWRGNIQLMAEYKQDREEGLTSLRRIAAKEYEGQPTRAVYY